MDFFLTDDGPVLNEVNTMPGMTAESQVPRMLAAAGVPYEELVARLVDAASVAATAPNAGEFVDHRHLVLTGGQHPHSVESVLLNIGPPGVDHGRLGGVLVPSQMNPSGLGVVVGSLIDLAAPQLREGIPVEVELLPLVAGAVAFVSIGVLLGTILPSARAAQAVGLLLYFPSLLLGVGGPPAFVMPPGLRALAENLPLALANQAIRDPWLGLGPPRSH